MTGRRKNTYLLRSTGCYALYGIVWLYVKKMMKYFPVPEGESWRPPLLSELLNVRDDISTLPGFSLAEVDEILKFVCCS